MQFAVVFEKIVLYKNRKTYLSHKISNFVSDDRKRIRDKIIPRYYCQGRFIANIFD